MANSVAKAAGLPKPTAEEKDPAFLALRVTALKNEVDYLKKARASDVQMLHQAMSISDMHQQILQRVMREVTFALHSGSTDHITTFSDGRLNFQDYYNKYREVIETAGEKYAEVAVVIWSHGHSVEEAVARAKVEVDSRSEAQAPPVDSDYEVEHFGGTSGQSSNEQVASASQAAG